MASAAGDLLKSLCAGIHDGSFSEDEASEVLEACAELMDALAENHVKNWWGRLVLNAASAAIRKATDEIGNSQESD